MSKLTFRSRTLDATRPMPIYWAEELPDLPEYCGINRSVPQMPTGMEKEEESERDLQQAMNAGHIIPTPEVEIVPSQSRPHLTEYKMPRQLIHMQPFAMEHDYPDYDMDTEDELFVETQSDKLSLSKLKFEELIEKLEKASCQKVIVLEEAKKLLEGSDDLIITVYDYWLNKRLRTQVPLMPTVKTDNRLGSAVNPYVAFRRRTEKMQTRKNRKNDEVSYEKMLKLKRDLSRTLELLEMTKDREVLKRDLIQTNIEIYLKRYLIQDFSGRILAELSAIRTPRPAFAPLFPSQFIANHHWPVNSLSALKDEHQREKRQYKRRKHKSASARSKTPLTTTRRRPTQSSDDEGDRSVDDGPFAFRRKSGVRYLPAVPLNAIQYPEDRDERYRFYPTALRYPTDKFLGFCRRRVGRGGRVMLDRVKHSPDMKIDPTQIYRPQMSSDQVEDCDPHVISSLPNTLVIDFDRAIDCDNHSSTDGYKGNFQTVEEKLRSGGKIGPKPTSDSIHKTNDPLGSKNQSIKPRPGKWVTQFSAPLKTAVSGTSISENMKLFQIEARASVKLVLPDSLFGMNDDSLALLDKIGLDVIDTDAVYDKSAQQNQETILHFNETDFLKYETDLDGENLRLFHNDVVGGTQFFSITPNSKFTVTQFRRIPMENEKSKAELEKVNTSQNRQTSPTPAIQSPKMLGETQPKKSSQKSKALRQNSNARSPSVSFMKKELNRQYLKDSALNHHNYTIAPPPFVGRPPKVMPIISHADCIVPVNTPAIGTILSRQLLKPQILKPKPVATQTLGVTKLKTFSGARVTQNVSHPPISSHNLHSQSSIAALLREPSRTGMHTSFFTNPVGEKTLVPGSDSDPDQRRYISHVALPRLPTSAPSDNVMGTQTYQSRNLLSGSQTMTLTSLLTSDALLPRNMHMLNPRQQALPATQTIPRTTDMSSSSSNRRRKNSGIKKDGSVLCSNDASRRNQRKNNPLGTT